MGSLGKQVVSRAEEMEGEEFCFAIILSKFVVLSSF